MNIVCLDLEGVLVPEIWINVALKTGIEELKLTTRDISDYNVLMNKRLGILKENNLKLKDIQNVIKTLDPLEGAVEFVQNIRSEVQLVILSDTFTQFARPLMEKLAWPTLLCNSLIINEADEITGFSMRQINGKKQAVDSFRSMNCRILAAGDSYNDTDMLLHADRGFLFRSPESIQKEFPSLKALETYSELKSEIFSFFEIS